ncbi:MAG: tetratricopeptide repeat protein, partial [Acidimicrobiales bacterium]
APLPAAAPESHGRLPGWVPTLVVAALLGVLLGRFLMAGGGTSAPPASPSTDRSTDAQIASLQTRLAEVPDDPGALTNLGVAYLSRAKETADPTWYARAEETLARSDALAPDQVRTLTAQGLLALARHDFAKGLELGNRAHALAPLSPDPLGIVFDAQVELGQYPEAAAAAQQMVDRRPSLASLARVSYIRELTGDHSGALTTMAQAATAGSASAADLAYVQTLFGDLRLGAGDLDAADAAYVKALETEPGNGGAEVGRARVAAARGDLAGAAARLEPVVTSQPAAPWVTLLGDVYSVLGRDADAAVQYERVRQIDRNEQANGVILTFDMARFEADHTTDPGADPAAVVDLARLALAERPTVFAEDALGWALRQAGRSDEALPHARAAVRIGTGDALLWWHLARTEADLGMVDDARRDLAKAFSLNRWLSVRDLSPARALAGELGVSV